MKSKKTRQIAQVLLAVIGIVFFITVFDSVSYFLERKEHYDEMDQLDQQANQRNLWFSNLAKINFYIKNQEYKNAVKFLDSLISIDSSRVDFHLKRGFVNYKLNKLERAEFDFRFVLKMTESNLGDQKYFHDKKEQYFYAMIGLMMVDDSFDKLTLGEYNKIKKRSYVSASLDTIRRRLVFNVDSVISKQIYDFE
ncbi:MAG TPA: hypothetical protein PLK63_14175 [Catalimonadaceae bacterium]|nr:hypothetical protein [Catalimonadaceae bacterium]